MNARAWILSWVYRMGYQAMRPYWLLARPSKPGVKCLITRGDEVLLVRHTYGARKRWELPGGSSQRGEQPIDTARREMLEELGVSLDDWTAIGRLVLACDHRRDLVSIFRADVGELALTLERAEIAEAQWFPQRNLPDRTGRHVRRMIALSEGRAWAGG